MLRKVKEGRREEERRKRGLRRDGKETVIKRGQRIKKNKCVMEVVTDLRKNRQNIGRGKNRRRVILGLPSVTTERIFPTHYNTKPECVCASAMALNKHSITD